MLTETTTKLVNQAKKEKVVEISDKLVRIKTKYLIRYMSAKQLMYVSS